MKLPPSRRGSVLINQIWISPDRRQFLPEKVAALAASIADVGLLAPITVRIAERVVDPVEGELTDVTALVAGRHRLEAAKSLGMDQIECNFADFDDLLAELAEIDENLMRANLSPAQEAAAMTRRKAIYETLHPETKAGTAGGRARHGAANEKSAFAESTADATGKSRRSVEMAAARGAALGDDLKAVAGTSLDKGVELDALAKLPLSERSDVISRAKAGETVSARAIKIDADVKRRADEAASEILIEDLSHGRLEAFVSHLFTAGHKSLAMTLRNKLGETIMDRRYA